MIENWIKLYPKILDWEWYKDQNTKCLFIHCLLKANWKDGKFEGYDIPRGSFVTSVKTLSEELSSKNQKVTVQAIRTALKHLISTNEITIKTTNKFTIISVKNYDKYQETNKVSNNQLTNNQQTTNNQLTTIEEYKNIEYINNIKKEKYKKEKNQNEVKAKTHNGNGIVDNYFNNKNVLKERFLEFLEIRKKLKAVNSERAVKLLLKDLENKSDIEQLAMIEKSIKNSWKGLYELKPDEKRRIAEIPEWFNKTLLKEETTPEEKRYLDELLKEFK